MNSLFIRSEDGKCYMDADVFKYSTASGEDDEKLAREISYDYATRYEEVIEYINKRYANVKDYSIKNELEEILNKFDNDAYCDRLFGTE
jgi:hypothetical protein